ncbi:ATP-binding cassette domain-containing protein [Peribacillus sp. FSL K6-5616]|uniref:ABC transporter ATP-binding protein n=1 Tax=Peribacillus simplex TaxID=1478 RepID=A0AAN2TS52_9BACI|nr:MULTISPECIES: ATP-binding cassette domain-containing protein [Bacillaceae]MCP1095423.1 ATP-binding cassette domain-containing protein [Bacillaceae bacterium OS4b]MCF7621554.1 ATP-binding cassette domain-containing protein [Peribacillus frigoritolerans]MCP1152211.1 ATP-binding cassette domain-containing protein [Peribacillus frigoritolerans]MCT1389807.1 ATP-binding cassette domain-containing protein [Peribacillus frigoritolerans]MEA3572641.1 ATP-binding cassette domain-containing protein [Pe
MIFRLENIKYKGILNIDDLQIPAYMVTCLTGESGAGKTSLLRLLNRMDDPDSGSIYYQDQLLDEFNPIELRRKVTMLSQAPFSLPGTIEENLQIGLELTEREKKDKEELVKALETVQLQKSLDESAENLSGGEKQRLALARLLLLNPEVYLLDEPTSALDEEAELTVMGRFLEKVKREKGTVIMITHSKQLADMCAEQRIVLKKAKESDY